jgi:hypothetical protein
VLIPARNLGPKSSPGSLPRGLSSRLIATEACPGTLALDDKRPEYKAS